MNNVFIVRSYVCVTDNLEVVVIQLEHVGLLHIQLIIILSIYVIVQNFPMGNDSNSKVYKNNLF